MLLHIRKQFNKAGIIYNWMKEYPNSTGLGINAVLLMGEGEIEVAVGDKSTVFLIERAEARAIAKKYNSYYDAYGTKLLVIPWIAFRKIGEQPKPTIKLIEIQKKLFRG